MSTFSMIAWKLRSNKSKLKVLRKRGLIIGGGCEVLNGYEFGSEPYLISIGDNVRIAAGVRFSGHDGGVWVLRNLYPELKDADLFGRIVVGDNCHIGINAAIMPGVTIGKNCIVGAYAVVTRDVPDNMVVAGIPARPICSIEEYRNKHRNDFMFAKHMEWDEKRRYVENHL